MTNLTEVKHIVKDLAQTEKQLLDAGYPVAMLGAKFVVSLSKLKDWRLEVAVDPVLSLQTNGIGASTESIVDWELSILLCPPKLVIFGHGNWLC